jgi:hypothetical protein
LDILEMSDYSQAGLWLDDASSLAPRTSISGSGTFDLKLGAMQYGVAGNVRFDTLEISPGYDLNRLGCNLFATSTIRPKKPGRKSRMLGIDGESRHGVGADRARQ